MKEKQFKRSDKTMHIAEYFYTKKIVEPILPYISKTFITPNMVTITNIILSFVMFYLAYNKYYVTVALLIQVYLFLDILDGNLARYKNMKSKLGANLDNINDSIFYNGIFIALGINSVGWYYILAVVTLISAYRIIPTYYIVPRLRKLKVVERKGIKKYFMDRGYIIGMDLGTLDIISSIMLLFGLVKYLYIILIFGYVFDIIYRIIELKRNEKLPVNKLS